MKHNYYGKLGVKDLDNRIYKLWLSRDEELPLCEPVGWSWMYETDPNTEELVGDILFLTKLSDKEICVICACVLEGATLQEYGKEISRTKERVRQILAKALRKMRYHSKSILGIGTGFKPHKTIAMLIQERREMDAFK